MKARAICYKTLRIALEKNQQKCLECWLIREIRKHGYKQGIKNTLAALKKASNDSR